MVQGHPVFADAAAGAALQTWAALGVVAITAVWLVIRLFAKSRGSSGCGSGGCGAVSPDARKLQAHLKKKHHGGAIR